MVPAENIALLKSTGLHRVFLPRAYGGYEAPLPVLTHCLMDIAGACASTAWAFGLMCTHHFMLAHFPKRLQDEVWLHSPDTTASSSIAPLGQHEEVDGGIRLAHRPGLRRQPVRRGRQPAVRRLRRLGMAAKKPAAAAFP